MLANVRVQVLALHVDHAIEDHSALGLAQRSLRLLLAPLIAVLSEIFHLFCGAGNLALLVHRQGLQEFIESHPIVLEELLEETGLLKHERATDDVALCPH